MNRIVLDDVLKGKKKVALGGHVRPDGDCVGSCLGLFLYLEEQYPDVETHVYLETIPDAYTLIQGTDRVRTELPEGEPYDLFICLDCGDAQRLGFSMPLFESAKETLCIDHHVSNEAFADINYIVPDASSTSELVFTLLDREKISKACAEALYMGIAHDTGVFQYSCTSPETMEIAAELMRKGINSSEIIDKTYYEKTYIQNQILGRALLESMLIMDKQCIVSVIRRRSMEFFQAQPSDLEGIVSQLRLTKGVEVAIFLHETDRQTEAPQLDDRMEGTGKPRQMDLFEENFLKREVRAEYRLIGQVFDTYWLVQFQDSLYIIDQHAAHERVLYERTLKEMKTREYTSQYLSPPIILSLSMQEAQLLNEHMDRFTRIGFEIEPFGGEEFAVRAIPDNLFGIAKKELLMEMIDDLSDGISTNMAPDLIDEKVASMSCKAAVKGNSRLSAQEVDALIGELLTLDNPYHCPHGRPTIIAMTKRELEKKFKRIV